MTQTLKKQLLLCAGGALLAPCGALWAQGQAKPGEPKNVNPLAAIFGRARENTRRSSCQSNLKQIGLGIVQYAQDYDELMPPAREWIDRLQPYVKSEAVFNCPSLPAGKRYGYALNAKAAAKSFALFDSPSQTVAVYETQILKRSAFGMGEFRANRHLGGANFTFIDGHVKWLAAAAKPSFNLKP